MEIHMDALHPGATGKAALSIQEFCATHGISRRTYYHLKEKGKGPREMQVGTRRLISLESAATWRRQMEAA
jgi:predicted DNA-binding transcriptional regulator AlpA